MLAFTAVLGAVLYIVIRNEGEDGKKPFDSRAAKIREKIVDIDIAKKEQEAEIKAKTAGEVLELQEIRAEPDKKKRLERLSGFLGGRV